MNITFKSQVFPDDTIVVTGSRPAPGFFSKMLGINSVTVHATLRRAPATRRRRSGSCRSS